MNITATVIKSSKQLSNVKLISIYVLLLIHCPRFLAVGSFEGGKIIVSRVIYHSPWMASNEMSEIYFTFIAVSTLYASFKIFSS